MKIRSLIVADDLILQEQLLGIFYSYFPELEVLDLAISGEDGLRKIAQHHPELLFIEVRLPDMSGFEVVRNLDSAPLKIIFITEESDLQEVLLALRLKAHDYLAKPLNLLELRQAINRFKTEEISQFAKEKARHKRQKFTSPKENTVVIPTHSGELRMPVEDIIRVEGERNYSFFHLVNQRKKLTSRALGYLEELLSTKGFFRCHKSYLVNRMHIQSLVSPQSLLMSDGKEIPISRRKRAAFLAWYEHPASL